MLSKDFYVSQLRKHPSPQATVFIRQTPLKYLFPLQSLLKVQSWLHFNNCCWLKNILLQPALAEPNYVCNVAALKIKCPQSLHGSCAIKINEI